MKLEQAIQIIKNATAQYRGTLQDHNQIQTAIALIENEISKDKKENKKDERK